RDPEPPHPAFARRVRHGARGSAEPQVAADHQRRDAGPIGPHADGHDRGGKVVHRRTLGSRGGKLRPSRYMTCGAPSPLRSAGQARSTWLMIIECTQGDKWMLKWSM